VSSRQFNIGLRSLQVLLQRGSNLGSGAMEEHSLVSLSDFENVTDFCRAQAVHISQGDDGPLTNWQIGDGPVNELPRFV
jgi:hypothetical protein